MSIKPLELNAKTLKLMKPVTSANYTEKTVLTNSSWEYVELWLKRQNYEKSKRALFYWLQAKSFFNASECLPVESRPLTSYYCCLNAAKALLSIRGRDNIDFDNTLFVAPNPNNYTQFEDLYFETYHFSALHIFYLPHFQTLDSSDMLVFRLQIP